MKRGDKVRVIGDVEELVGMEGMVTDADERGAWVEFDDEAGRYWIHASGLEPVDTWPAWRPPNTAPPGARVLIKVCFPMNCFGPTRPPRVCIARWQEPSTENVTRVMDEAPTTIDVPGCFLCDDGMAVGIGAVGLAGSIGAVGWMPLPPTDQEA